MNDINIMFNSNLTYVNGLSEDFVNKLKFKREITYQDSEFITYSFESFTVIIDSLLTVYIKPNHFNGNLENIIALTKSEYLFICSLDKRFDPNTKIDLYMPKTQSYKMVSNGFEFNDLEDVLYLTV